MMAGEINSILREDRSDTEYLDQMRRHIAVISGLLVVSDPLTMTTTTMPTNSSWTVNCGSGLSITFGNSILSSANDGQPYNGSRLTLALNRIDKSRCEKLSLELGRELLRILVQSSAVE